MLYFTFQIAPVPEKVELTPEDPEQPWRDIDGDTKDPMFSPEYAHEIFTNLQKRELDFLVKDYLSEQTEITVTMRAILIDWLVEVFFRKLLAGFDAFLRTNLCA